MHISLSIVKYNYSWFLIGEASGLSNNYFSTRQNKVPFSMVIGNVTRARVFSQTLVHGNSKIKKDKDTEEEGKKSGVNMEPTPKQWIIIT